MLGERKYLGVIILLRYILYEDIGELSLKGLLEMLMSPDPN